MKQNKTKNLLSKRLIYIITALAASLALWVYVRNDVNPYSDPWVYRIPVTFTGSEIMEEERSLVMLSGEDTTIDLHLYGKRKDVSALSRSNIEIRVDLSTVRNAGAYSLDYEIVYPDGISENAITLLERSPSSVWVTTGKLLTKPVDVRGSGGSPAEGYLAESMLCTPEQIMVRGPEEIVSRISHASVVLERDNLERTVNATLPYTLIDTDGNPVDRAELSCDVEQIEVELPIVATKTVKLTTELIDGSGATEEDAICKIKPETITISGDAETLKGINQISLGTIDLSEVFGQATLTRSIALPNNTQNLSGEEEAEITITLKGLDSRTVRTTNIELINQPDEEHYDYTVISSALSVIIRGKTAVVEQIYSSNLRVVVDMADYTVPGQYKIPVSVYIDGYADVGILYEDEYEVVVAITEKRAEPVEVNPEESEA